MIFAVLNPSGEFGLADSTSTSVITIWQQAAPEQRESVDPALEGEGAVDEALGVDE